MRRIVFYFILLISLTNCSHRILRTDYNVDKSDYKTCDVAINKFMAINDSIKKIGEIKLGESGFSVSCSEKHAMEILRNEACALNADVINIIEETRPDLWSSCYRCRAEFYKFNTTQKVKPQTDEFYNEENLSERVTKDRTKNTIVGILAVAIGFTIGYFLFQ